MKRYFKIPFKVLKNINPNALNPLVVPATYNNPTMPPPDLNPWDFEQLQKLYKDINGY